MIKKIIKLLLWIIISLPIIVLIYKWYNWWKIDPFLYKWLSFFIPSLFNTLKIFWYVFICHLITSIPLWIILWIYNIKYKKIFIWSYILPLIFPSYILALLYSDILPTISNILELSFILWIGTLPYIFWILYFASKSIWKKYIITGESLGLWKTEIIRKIVLPLIKPSIIVWFFITLAEVFSEFWASFYYWINTLSTLIYKLWFSVYNTQSASIIWLLIISILFILFLFFNPYKTNINKYINNGNNNSDINNEKYKIDIDNKIIKWTIYLYMIFISIIVLILPLLILIKWLYISKSYLLFQSWFHLLYNSLLITLFVIILSLIFGYLIFILLRKNKYLLNLINIIYSIPWILIWISILSLTPFVNSYIFAYIFLIFWLLLKNLSLIINNLFSQYIKINTKLKKIWYSLWRNKISYKYNIEIPLLKKWFIMWWIIIFLEIIRELPITLILKPFNFETLATKIFFYSATEQIYLTSFWILLIILISIIPIIYVNKNKFNI